MWGLIPAAGLGSRIQPLAFSKELLPLGTHCENGRERPRAISEYLIERMICAGVSQLCFVISPDKTDILRYYGNRIDGVDVCYVVQSQPGGLCDALFRAEFLAVPDDFWIVGLPDTIWFPADALMGLPDDPLSFLLFPVEQPALFDAVLTDETGRVSRIEVKQAKPATHWVWGAFKMRGSTYQALCDLWHRRKSTDEYWGTLVNAYLHEGGSASGIQAGKSYVDVGTVRGYQDALGALKSWSEDRHASSAVSSVSHLNASWSRELGTSRR